MQKEAINYGKNHHRWRRCRHHLFPQAGGSQEDPEVPSRRSHAQGRRRRQGADFSVCAGCGRGSINANGAEFCSATHDDEKLATITMALPCIVEDVKKEVAELIGTAILNLNKLETGLPAVLEEIDAQTAEILDNITVA